MMVSIKNTFFICSTFIFLLSCKTQQVQVKFHNSSEYDFKEFRGKLGDSLVIINDLLAGENSKFYLTNHTHSIFNAQIIVGSDTLDHSIIDYVGEKYYKHGKIKFSLYVVEDRKDKSKTLRMKAKRILF